jgi:hypothetical protein
MGIGDKTVIPSKGEPYTSALPIFNSIRLSKYHGCYRKVGVSIIWECTKFI